MKNTIIILLLVLFAFFACAYNAQDGQTIEVFDDVPDGEELETTF